MYKIIYVRPITRELFPNKMEKSLTPKDISNFYLDLVYYSLNKPQLDGGTLIFKEALHNFEIMLSGDFLVNQMDSKSFTEELELAKTQEMKWQMPKSNVETTVQQPFSK